jgi:hypothetical protein
LRKINFVRFLSFSMDPMAQYNQKALKENPNNTVLKLPYEEYCRSLGGDVVSPGMLREAAAARSMEFKELPPSSPWTKPSSALLKAPSGNVWSEPVNVPINDDIHNIETVQVPENVQTEPEYKEFLRQMDKWMGNCDTEIREGNKRLVMSILESIVPHVPDQKTRREIYMDIMKAADKFQQVMIQNVRKYYKWYP